MKRSKMASSSAQASSSAEGQPRRTQDKSGAARSQCAGKKAAEKSYNGSSLICFVASTHRHPST